MSGLVVHNEITGTFGYQGVRRLEMQIVWLRERETDGNPGHGATCSSGNLTVGSLSSSWSRDLLFHKRLYDKRLSQYRQLEQNM